MIFTENLELGRWMGNSGSLCKRMRCLSISRIWRRGKCTCVFIFQFKSMKDFRSDRLPECLINNILFLVSLLAQCGFTLILHSGRTNCHPSNSNIACHNLFDLAVYCISQDMLPGAVNHPSPGRCRQHNRLKELVNY